MSSANTLRIEDSLPTYIIVYFMLKVILAKLLANQYDIRIYLI